MHIGSLKVFCCVYIDVLILVKTFPQMMHLSEELSCLSTIIAHVCLTFCYFWSSPVGIQW